MQTGKCKHGTATWQMQTEKQKLGNENREIQNGKGKLKI